MKTSDTVSAIAAALVKAQAVMHGATKDAKNPAFRSSYASLSSVIEAARGPLTENGIAFLQAPGAILEEGIPITTTLVHSSGEWISSTIIMPLATDKRTAQGVGSAITYGCRYSLMAMLGLPPVDDDGTAAMERPDATERRSPAPQVPSPAVPAKGADTPFVTNTPRVGDPNDPRIPPSPSDPESRKIAFIKASLVFVTGQRGLVQWELDNSVEFDSLSPEGKAEIEQAKKDRIAELKRRAA
jgi:hypothetical protein